MAFRPYLSLGAVSYEGSLFGLDVEVDPNSEEIIRSRLDFAFHETPGSLKAIAVSRSGKYLICGGMDEQIRIFNLKEKRSAGEMTGHSGCITSLAFVGEKFVISGSEDGTMIIWGVSNWKKLHVLGGHKAAVNHFALHPSGKLCVSVSKDNTMKIWNLVHGRCAFTRRLKGPADRVGWHKTTDFYFLVVGNEVQIYNSGNNNECTATVTCGSRVNNACFVDITSPSSDDKEEEEKEKSVYIAIICDNKTVRIVDKGGNPVGPTYSLAQCFQGSRPKDVNACRATNPNPNPASEFSRFMEGEGDCLVLVSSAGHLEVLSARRLSEGPDHRGQEGEEEGKTKTKTKTKTKGATPSSDANHADPVAFARLASWKIDSEPRLTAVVAYNPATGDNMNPRAGTEADPELMTQIGTDNDDNDGGEETRKVKKGKKRKGVPTAEDGGESTQAKGSGKGRGKGNSKGRSEGK